MPFLVDHQPIRNAIKIFAAYLLPVVVFGVFFDELGSLLVSIVGFGVAFFIIRKIMASDRNCHPSEIEWDLVFVLECEKTAPLGWMFIGVIWGSVLLIKHFIST